MPRRREPLVRWNRLQDALIVHLKRAVAHLRQALRLDYRLRLAAAGCYRELARERCAVRTI